MNYGNTILVGLAQLLQRVATQDPPQARSEDLARRADEAPDVAADEEASAGSGGGAGAAGAFWARIAPCWRGISRASAAPVTLEITLDGVGNASAPPRILRDGPTRLPESRLRAEAAALAALRVCMPQGDARFGGRTYRLEFGR